MSHPRLKAGLNEALKTSFCRAPLWARNGARETDLLEALLDKSNERRELRDQSYAAKGSCSGNPQNGESMTLVFFLSSVPLKAVTAKGEAKPPAFPWRKLAMLRCWVFTCRKVAIASSLKGSGACVFWSPERLIG